MKRKKVVSSVLLSIGYDMTTGTLEIEFNSGSVYRYYDVPEPIYEQLMTAESKGGFFNACREQ